MNKEILAKIRKCLALAQSPNANEASTALAAAQALMAKHDVTEIDAMLSDIREMEVTTGKTSAPPIWLKSLIQVVSDAFGVHPLHCHNFGRSVNRVAFIGPDSSAEIAAYAFTVLRRQITKSRHEYFQSLPGRRSIRTRKADIFAVAWVQAVKKRVRVFAGKPDPRIKDYIERNYPDLGQMKDKKLKISNADTGPIIAGYNAGGKVNIHPGVNGIDRRFIGHEA